MNATRKYVSDKQGFALDWQNNEVGTDRSRASVGFQFSQDQNTFEEHL
jgi:hypothetical protein